MRRISLLLLALLLPTGLIAPTTAQAVLIRVDFSVLGASNDPANAGVTASGYFTYDPAILPPGGAFGGSFETDLSFAWDGVTYTKNNADLYGIFVNASGNPTDWRLTNPQVQGQDWFYFGPTYGFQYYRAATNTRYFGSLSTWSYSEVPAAPEPHTLALLLSGLLPLGPMLRRRHKA